MVNSSRRYLKLKFEDDRGQIEGKKHMPIETMKASKIMIMTENGLQEFYVGEILLETKKDESFELNETIEISKQFGGWSFEVDKKKIRKIIKAIQPKHGEKIEMQCSCICDGTLAFAIELIRELKRRGCVNIRTRSEYIENEDKQWMKTKYVATGILFNTNNWRKMHGVPVHREKRL